MSNAGEMMTNEQAIKILEKLKTAKDISFLCFSQRLALGMAIHALKEQQGFARKINGLKRHNFNTDDFKEEE